MASRLLPALLLAGLVLSGSGVRAAAESGGAPAESFDREMRQAQQLLQQGLETMIGSVQGLLRAIPRYEMPRVNERGDIIIRRKPPPDVAPEDGTPAQPGGRTI